MKVQQFGLFGKNGSNYSWLLLGAILTYLYSGNLAVSFAAWLGPVFIVRFIRIQKPLRGLVTAWLVLMVIAVLQNKEIFPIPGPAYYFIIGFLSLIGLLPYIADRLLNRRIGGFAGTLILPTAWVAVDYLTSFGGWGTWGAIAYTQVDNLPLLQLSSVTGMWGITFLMIWFASFMNWAWEQNFDWVRIRSCALVYVTVLGLVLIGGGLRLRVFTPAADNVRVASISVPNLDVMQAAYRARYGQAIDVPKDIAQSDARVQQLSLAFQEFTQDPDNPIYVGAHAALDHLEEELFDLTLREARSGASVVTWSEGNGLTLKSNEAAFLMRAQELAQDEGLTLAVPMYVIALDSGLSENKVVTIGPDGQVKTVYHKTKLVPGEASLPGDGSIPVFQSSFGGLGSVICYDMDFPSYIRRAVSRDLDILLVPSGDWKGISPIHSEMAIMRAVENGFSMVRQASRGHSWAVDYMGQTLATMDYFRTEEKVMLAQIPTKGVSTIYSHVGDLFAWLAIAGFAGLLLPASLLRRRSPRK